MFTNGSSGGPDQNSDFQFRWTLNGGLCTYAISCTKNLTKREIIKSETSRIIVLYRIIVLLLIYQLFKCTCNFILVLSEMGWFHIRPETKSSLIWSKMFDTLVVILKEFYKKLILKKRKPAVDKRNACKT